MYVLTLVPLVVLSIVGSVQSVHNDACYPDEDDTDRRRRLERIDRTKFDRIDFIVLGDWGKYSEPESEGESDGHDDGQPSSGSNQFEIAQAMKRYVILNNLELDYIATVGDNFYMDGVASVWDPLWNQVWREVYLNDCDALVVPWHPVLGNHDHGQGKYGTDAQIQRTTATDDAEWLFLDYDYTTTYNAPSGLKVYSVYVDTNTLAPEGNKITDASPETIWRTICSPIRWVYELIRQYRQTNTIQLQLNTIEADLQAARTGSSDDPTWVVVVGHHPMFSPGKNGDTIELHKHLMPLLEKYNVDAYFSGHDHLSAHMRNNGVEYFLAGAGAITSEVLSVTTAQEMPWVGPEYTAFAAVEATSMFLTVGYYNNTGFNVYNYTIYKSNHTNTTEPIE